MSANTTANQEILKRVYVDPVEKVVVKTNVLRNKIKFDNANKVGDKYVGAVQLRRPQGFTYAGGALRGTAWALNGAIAGTTKQVFVTPHSLMLEEAVSYDLIAAATSSENSFDPQVGLIISGMVESHDQRYEMDMLYGGASLGIGNTNTGASPNGIHQISKASWSPHIWGPLEGTQLDAYSDAALTVKVTANGPASLTAVDMDARTLYVTYASAADYTAANAASAALYFTAYGAVGNVTLGVQPLISLSASGGTVFELNTSLYGYMRASTKAISGALTFTKIAQAATLPANKGGMGDLDVVVNTYSWTDMMNDQAALRQYVSTEGGTFENGADELVYHGPNGGKLVIQCDPMLKAEHALIVNFDDWKSIGATLPTFNLRGAGHDNANFLYEMPGNAGYAMRRYSQTGTYCQRLARQCLLTGIVNSSGPDGGGT
jgi:hypothetical protein